MRIASILSLSIALALLAAGCGESTPPPAADASAAPASPANSTAKKGPISKGKQTFETRRTYSAASPDGPPSKY
jgi:hypothetical protein